MIRKTLHRSVVPVLVLCLVWTGAFSFHLLCAAPCCTQPTGQGHHRAEITRGCPLGEGYHSAVQNVPCNMHKSRTFEALQRTARVLPVLGETTSHILAAQSNEKLLDDSCAFPGCADKNQSVARAAPGPLYLQKHSLLI